MPKKILMLLVLFLALWGCKDNTLNLKIKYDRIDGLEAGDRVLFEQNHIGHVAGVSYSEKGYYLVDVAIKKAFANAATQGSKFFITEDSKNRGKKAIDIIQASQEGLPLKDGATVEGSDKPSALCSQLGQSLAEQVEGIKKAFEHLSEEIIGAPESEEFKRLERELERLREEMKRSGESVREKMEQEWLPQLQQEIERLRKRLHKFGRENEVKDLEIELERIKEIEKR
jgi:HPt (histidine-containing phosphotransfer) domain-containing protein